MNEQPEHKETDVIRSEIDTTRRRMDQTIDALGERLKGRHLLDEVIGFFRPKDGSTAIEGDTMMEKIKDSAGSAANAVVDTVKRNPIPTVLIGAGVAWAVYQSRRGSSQDEPMEVGGGSDDDYESASTADLGYNIPSKEKVHPTGFYREDFGAEGVPETLEKTGSGQASSTPESLKEEVAGKVAELKRRLEEVTSETGDKVRRFRRNTRRQATALYNKSKDQVVSSVEEHPLGVGLGTLVAGLLVGLLLPTPEVVNSLAGERSEKLRQQAREKGRDLAQRGRKVIDAGTAAMREEAKAQGILPRTESNVSPSPSAQTQTTPTAAEKNEPAGENPATPPTP